MEPVELKVDTINKFRAFVQNYKINGNRDLMIDEIRTIISVHFDFMLDKFDKSSKIISNRLNESATTLFEIRMHRKLEDNELKILNENMLFDKYTFNYDLIKAPIPEHVIIIRLNLQYMINLGKEL